MGKYFVFFIFKNKELLKITFELSEEDLCKCFIGSINDYDNDCWIFAYDKNCTETIEFKKCEYLDCFLECGIAIFTQYDSDGVEFQIHKDYDKLLKLLEKVLN